MHHVVRSFLLLSTVATVCWLTPVTAFAQADDVILVETVRATTYLNGGFGKDEADAMRRMAKEFPLRLTFSERKDNEFVADVQVLITDSKGSPVFYVPSAGPLLYVMMPHGKYRVSASFHGLTEHQTVTIGAGEGKDLSFHWQGTPKKG